MKSILRPRDAHSIPTTSHQIMYPKSSVLLAILDKTNKLNHGIRIYRPCSPAFSNIFQKAIISSINTDDTINRYKKDVQSNHEYILFFLKIKYLLLILYIIFLICQIFEDFFSGATFKEKAQKNLLHLNLN